MSVDYVASVAKNHAAVVRMLRPRSDMFDVAVVVGNVLLVPLLGAAPRHMDTADAIPVTAMVWMP